LYSELPPKLLARQSITSKIIMSISLATHANQGYYRNDIQLIKKFFYPAP
jgi:hypothetical protein